MPMPVRLVDGLSSERNNPGDTFTATLDKELVVDGFVIAGQGARVEGRVVFRRRAARPPQSPRKRASVSASMRR
jgi:hypothetical protein